MKKIEKRDEFCTDLFLHKYEHKEDEKICYVKKLDGCPFHLLQMFCGRNDNKLDTLLLKRGCSQQIQVLFLLTLNILINGK